MTKKEENTLKRLGFTEIDKSCLREFKIWINNTHNPIAISVMDDMSVGIVDAGGINEIVLGNSSLSISQIKLLIKALKVG